MLGVYNNSHSGRVPCHIRNCWRLLETLSFPGSVLLAVSRTNFSANVLNKELNSFLVSYMYSPNSIFFSLVILSPRTSGTICTCQLGSQQETYGTLRWSNLGNFNKTIYHGMGRPKGNQHGMVSIPGSFPRGLIGSEGIRGSLYWNLYSSCLKEVPGQEFCPLEEGCSWPERVEGMQ